MLRIRGDSRTALDQDDVCLSTCARCSGKTGGFLRTVVYTSLTFLALQCFMQIPFAYVPRSGKVPTTHLRG